MRKVAGFLVLAVALWLAYSVAAPTQDEYAGGPDIVWTSSAQCAECHREVYDEWKDSWHAKSWIDEDVRVQSNDFSNKDCIDCHAPQPVLMTGIDKRVLPRSSRRAEGVDCLSCHLTQDSDGRWAMAGTATIPGAPCNPVATIHLQRVDFCGTCHDQHKTVQQWLKTDWVNKDQDCIHCHMPFRDGDSTRGRHHGMAGGHDIELVKTAVALFAERVEGRVRVEVANVGAGHAYPTDERSRASDIFWRPVASADDPGGWRHLHRIRDPYRTEADIPSTLLHAHEVRELFLDDPDAAGEIEIALYYKLTPYYRDPTTGLARPTEEVDDPASDAQLVHRVVVPR